LGTAPRRRGNDERRIVQGRIVDPASKLDATGGVYIANGRIAGIGQAPDGFRADRTLDARGAIVAPGLVDLCARLREPGAEGALKVEMRAALAGGVTGVVCPPDTDPPLDEPGLVRMLRQRSRESAGARTYPLGALTVQLQGEVLAEIQTLAETGCVAFMQTRSLPHDNGVLLQAMRYARTFDLPLWLRPVEDTLAGAGSRRRGRFQADWDWPRFRRWPRRWPCTRSSNCSVPAGARAHLPARRPRDRTRAQGQGRGAAGHCRCHDPPRAFDRRLTSAISIRTSA
jgi:dihydroorotase-like cyclic amidohydrolase